MRNKRYSEIVSLVCFVLLLLIIAICSLINIASKQDKPIETSYRTYTVQQGDNLTKIANKYYTDTYLNEAIFEIKKENNLKSSSLEVGQVLKVRR
ncbi:MAG: LysM peptidoglycan-binding domain-containing protein [Clostridia bacterium]